ncbi:putative transcriptional regulator transcription regulator protein [Sulfitobacter noctilucicola]|uniref:DNA-binding transcriptional LysR family regulator n=1 Tax=Sulfitobacter noctilucicola TaxID=1342301 RepID=A0A7W6Q5F4_9RHOB|nr:LysR family transcriptional regulator [Sulfitobacter noctilucicola]KIN65171.1 putative transcriptional regulator transcription regulator protein [Sulfitobacter noctilucicola]MBB4173695.1 DNA-binding transcriptional LysR family regulator [Sulfitobacter noctilucicola]
MINWDDLKFCLALHRHGSMLNAGISLKANVATVSRRLERITQDAGKAIFIRKGQEWKPTAFGAELMNMAQYIDERLNVLTADEDELLAENALVRLSISLTIMQTFMADILDYRNKSDIPYNLDLTIRDRGLAYSETDLAVRYFRPDHGNFICAKVTELEVRPYVNVNLTHAPTEWNEVDYDGIRFDPAEDGFDISPVPRMRLEGLNLTAQSLKTGSRLAYFPVSFGDDIPWLKRAAPDRMPRTLEVWMVYHKTRKLDPVVRAAVDMIQATMS